MRILKNRRWIFFFLMYSIFAWSCQKKDKIFSEPYEEGKPALGIKLDKSQIPSPAFGLPGSTVTLKATGLLAYKDDLIFRFNGEDAEIQSVDDQEIKVIVPDHASTGILSLSVGDVVLFGPQYTVMGKISMDPSFQVKKGANGPVTMVMTTMDNKRIVVGGFTNYDNKGLVRPNNGIVRTFPDGTYDASFRTGKGANGFLESVLQLGDKYFIAGGFSGFDMKSGLISNLTRLNSNGTLDTIPFKTYRRPNQRDTVKYFPTFNGGFNSNIGQIYESEGKLIVSGSFQYYLKRIYDKPNGLETRDSIIIDSTEVHQLARLDIEGNLDKTYRFNAAANKSLPGANGPIRTYMHKEGVQKGKMLVFGSFTKFDNQDKRYLLRLNTDGSIDNKFNAGGIGPDFVVFQASYNAVTKKYLIVGGFKTYNGKQVSRIALLNEDGTMDVSFVAKEFKGGQPSFVKQLTNGLIIVSGDFISYDGVARNGFMVLDAKGDLKIGYNATGRFSGMIYDIIETQTEDEKMALLIYGIFYQFNSLPEQNIIRVILE